MTNAVVTFFIRFAPFHPRKSGNKSKKGVKNMRYYFKKPAALVNKQPVNVHKENGETIGIIMKSPAKISFFS
ncbi:hypothetical protein MAQA_03496 [Listeria aquatica FSL S10-1188]|uniref:Uncharacterized protein n=1 Tax=Listeria aquatica FSL S10-1188 TaxID=1265818 RepID=W7BD38_9LIST|nr:hypothetical protein MAQA_03496 [Listeria aquatica FSL S10-1188]